MRKNKLLLTITVAMAVMFLAAINLPEGSGWPAAILIAVPYFWLCAFAYVNFFRKKDRSEKHNSK